MYFFLNLTRLFSRYLLSHKGYKITYGPFQDGERRTINEFYQNYLYSKRQAFGTRNYLFRKSLKP